MSALSPIATAKALAKGHVRYTPETEHVQRTHACPLRATSGHSHCGKPDRDVLLRVVVIGGWTMLRLLAIIGMLCIASAAQAQQQQKQQKDPAKCAQKCAQRGGGTRAITSCQQYCRTGMPTR